MEPKAFALLYVSIALVGLVITYWLDKRGSPQAELLGKLVVIILVLMAAYFLISTEMYALLVFLFLNLYLWGSILDRFHAILDLVLFKPELEVTRIELMFEIEDLRREIKKIKEKSTNQTGQ